MSVCQDIPSWINTFTNNGDCDKSRETPQNAPVKSWGDFIPFLDALASLVLVMTVGLQFFREILSSGLEVNKTKEQKDNRISGLQPYNLTTLQLYNYTTIKH